MAEQQSVVLVVDIGDLDRGHNVRTGLGDLDTLVESVREVGILTPVTVSGHGANGDGRWVLVAGYRRVAAAEKAGLSQVPALVTEVAGDDERLVATLVENLVREDLDPVDEARGFALLVEAGWSQGKVSRRVGRSKGHVSKRLRLLVLPTEVQERVRAGDITVDHAYQISRLADRNVGAKKLISLSTKPVRVTEMELKEKASRDELDARVGEIRAAGLRAVIVKRYWNDPDHTALSQMWDLDPDAHTAERCHVVVLSRDWPESPITERPSCRDRSRHEPGGDSDLQLPDYDAIGAQANADRKARDAETAAEYARKMFDIGERLETVAEATVLDMALRVMALGNLHRVPDGDPLIPIPDHHTDPNVAWQYPPEAIAAVDAPTLARAFIRQKIDRLIHHHWWAGHHPDENNIIAGLAVRLGLYEPAEDDDGGEDGG